MSQTLQDAVTSLIDSKKYVVLTALLKNNSFRTTVSETLFGIVNPFKKPLWVSFSDWDTFGDAHVIIRRVVMREPRSKWDAQVRALMEQAGIIGHTFNQMAEHLKGFREWLGVDPETLPEEEREKKWSEYIRV